MVWRCSCSGFACRSRWGTRGLTLAHLWLWSQLLTVCLSSRQKVLGSLAEIVNGSRNLIFQAWISLTDNLSGRVLVLEKLMVLTTMLLLIVVGLAIAHDFLFFEGIFVLIKRNANCITFFSPSFVLFHLVSRKSLNVVLLVRHIHLLIAAVVSEFKIVTATVYVLNVLKIASVMEITTWQSFAAFFFLLLLWLISLSTCDIFLAA